MRLNKVVFPAPFGPIRPVIDPSSTFREQPATAVRPPKLFSNFWTSSMYTPINAWLFLVATYNRKAAADTSDHTAGEDRK